MLHSTRIKAGAIWCTPFFACFGKLSTYTSTLLSINTNFVGRATKTD